MGYVCPSGGRDGLDELLIAMNERGFEKILDMEAPARYTQNPLAGASSSSSSSSPSASSLLSSSVVGVTTTTASTTSTATTATQTNSKDDEKKKDDEEEEQQQRRVEMEEAAAVDAFLHFPELPVTEFRMYEFRRKM